MADKIKILIISDCKLGGKPLDKGTTIDIDPDNAADRNNYAALAHAGRVAEATPENIAKLKKEIEAQKVIDAAHAAAAKNNAPASVDQIVAAVLAALKTAKA